MPARNEAPTIAANIAAAKACAAVRRVIVVDDGSTDGTGDAARRAGADRVVRCDPGGSKAHAMAAGVDATPDADAIFFVDADCTGLTGAHLDAIAEPFLQERATMSLGAFDYGRFWNPMVLRWPPLTGERIIPRWVWDAIPEDKLDGYTIEVRINEVFSPTQEQFDRAWDILEAYEQATEGDRMGAVMFGDEMIDEASRKMAIKFVTRGERAGRTRSAET